MKHIGLMSVCALISLSPVALFAQQECVEGQSASTEQIFNNANSLCCAKSKSGAQKKCLKGAIRSLNRSKTVISKSLFQDAKTVLGSLRSGSCEANAIEVPTCDADRSTTATEAGERIEGNACNKRFKSDRQTALKKMKRVLRKARRFLGSDYVTAVNAEIKALQRSNSCGQGGEANTTGCSRIQGIRDGANGNVYKLSDHGGSPVFVTHDGSRSGTAITLQGELIQRLTYSGLANADPKGLRHHYRFSGSCRSLPPRFYMKLGGTCYEVNDPCGRID